MRATVLHAPGDIRLQTVADPEPRPGHAIVRVEAVGVCGSDLPRMLVKGAHKMPLVCGHEFSGSIESMAEDIADFTVGERVAVTPMLPCGVCAQCRQGAFSRCVDYDYFGSRRDGAYAEKVLVPASSMLKAPQNLDPRAIAMADPAAIARYAIGKGGGIATGQVGGVIGCGAIGLFAIQWMRLMGATEVIAMDVAPEKLELAKAAGATETILSGKPERTAPRCDLVVEAAGHPSAVNQAITMCMPGGNVVAIGIPVEDVTLRNATFQHLLRKEISLRGAWNSFSAPFPGSQWQATLDSLASGDLKWAFMISHELPLEDLPEIFAKLRNDPSFRYSKIMFRP